MGSAKDDVLYMRTHLKRAPIYENSHYKCPIRGCETTTYENSAYAHPAKIRMAVHMWRNHPAIRARYEKDAVKI